MSFVHQEKVDNIVGWHGYEQNFCQRLLFIVLSLHQSAISRRRQINEGAELQLQWSRIAPAESLLEAMKD